MALSDTILATVGTARDFGYFPSACQLQSVTTTQDNYGDPKETWTDAGDPIPCRIEPRGDVSTEVKRQDGTIANNARYIKFAHYEPDVTSKLRAIVDEEVWNILDVDSDAQKTRTRLIVERIN